MNIPQLATDIAARIPAMAQDTPINNADLIARLIFHECAGCNDIDRECAKWRGRCEQLESELRLLREHTDALRESVYRGGHGGMIAPHP